MAQLASDIIDKCKYIHPSRLEEIESLLIKLQKHSLAQGDGGAVDRNGDGPDNDEGQQANSKGEKGSKKRSGTSRSHSEEETGGGRGQNARSKEDNLPAADMNQLDDYLDMLYQVSGKSDREKEEGLRMQERGTAMILKLCRDVMNLEQVTMASHRVSIYL